MGNIFLAAAPAKGNSNSFLPILIIVALFVLLYFVMIRPQRNRQRQAVARQRAVEPGQRIRTTAGIYGTITAIMDDDVEVEIAPGVRIRMMRRAIMDVVADEISDPADPAEHEVSGQQDAGGPDDGQPPAQSSANGAGPADELKSQDRI